MRCPHCKSEIPFSEFCPQCGQKISYGGNTVLYKASQSGTLTYKEIFANTFKRHTMEDTHRSLAAVPGDNMLSSWERPWLFLRLFLVLLIMSVLLIIQSNHYSTLHASDMSSMFLIEFSFVTSLIGPFVIAMLVWEMDIHRQINFLNFLVLVFFGGILSTAIALPLNNAINGASWTAGLTEEATKLLISVLFIAVFRPKGLHCLDGLAIGGAVGAGFAFWENVFYAFLKSGSVGIMYMAMWRSFWGFFGSHMMYTAPYVGALCYAINGNKLQAKHFLNPFFLIMLAFGMGAHALNNVDENLGIALQITFGELVFPVFWIQIILGVFAWGLLLYMLRRGIRQALETNEIDQAVHYAHTEVCRGHALICREGTYAGNVFSLEVPLVIGRQPNDCNLILQSDAVSRKHCAIYMSGSQILLRDFGSSNGTKLNGSKISINQDISLQTGDLIVVGSERFEIA
ncbi:MAG: FHA domain-containing protein [Clostridia bacterium]|nr:FHA domain-containing protein [Clostridia bacterium]